MTRKLISLGTAALLFAGTFILLSGIAGCSTPDSDNISERPWNEPRGFLFQGNDRRDER